MENKANQNPQSNQNPSGQSGSKINTSSVGGSSQSSMSGSSSGSSSISSASGSQASSMKSSSGSSQSGSSSNAGKSNWMDTFKKENLNNLTDKLQEFGNTTMNKVNSLSTTQKVVGGSLLALGAGWVAMNSMGKGKGSMGSKIANAQEKLNRNLNKSLNKNK
jgi:hypothetical protein